MNEERKNRKKRKIQTVLSEIKSHPKVQSMKYFKQHGRVSTYEHCERVVSLSYDLNQGFHLHANEDTLLKGAMLHDFYLYDWHRKDGGSHDWHGFIHAERARKNASRNFKVNKDIQHVIQSHMWPLNLGKLPRSREAWIVCIADKCASLYETIFRR